MSRYQLEICANSVQSARAAQAGGAHRIELCQNLEQGGITPSYGLIGHVRAQVQVPVFVLIRPRPGDFVYDADEFAIMQADVRACQALGSAGVVLGLLTAAGQVDVDRCRALVRLAHPLPVTFHRAFDECSNLAAALEDVIATGCARLLTSGGHPTALAGQAQLAALVQQAAGRISIMPGAGLTPATLPSLAARTAAHEFHASAKRPLPAASLPPSPFQTARWETDATEVAALRQVIEALEATAK